MDKVENKETGMIWIITDQGAFARDLAKDWTYVAALPNAELTAVLPASDGSVWFGTADAGLIRFVPVSQ
jgi:ligand-binding sensor domain-containing protein